MGKEEADKFLNKEREHAKEKGKLYQYHRYQVDCEYEKLSKKMNKNDREKNTSTVSFGIVNNE